DCLCHVDTVVDDEQCLSAGDLLDAGRQLRQLTRCHAGLAKHDHRGAPGDCVSDCRFNVAVLEVGRAGHETKDRQSQPSESSWQRHIVLPCLLRATPDGSAPCAPAGKPRSIVREFTVYDTPLDTHERSPTTTTVPTVASSDKSDAGLAARPGHTRPEVP